MIIRPRDILYKEYTEGATLVQLSNKYGLTLHYIITELYSKIVK